MTNEERNEKLEEVREALAKATPGPWQRSVFVSHRRYDKMPEDWKAARSEEESRIIRGPGIVGTPGCNPILRADSVGNPADLDLIANAPAYLDFLLGEVERAVKDERESCAKVADLYGPTMPAFEIAETIRARK